MKIGLLTVPFRGESLSKVIDFASSAKFDSLEVTCGPGAHIDPTAFSPSDAETIKKQLSDAGLEISSLAMYFNTMDPDTEKRASGQDLLRKGIDAAQLLGVPTVCTLAGFPMPGKDKIMTIEEDCAPFFGAICEYAEQKGIKIALENWYATNIQNLDHWERLFKVVPNANFGLNFDPSHLFWQGIDYLRAVDYFADRIFHAHAKDCAIIDWRLKWYGSQAGGWWRYVIPGLGRIQWGEFVSALRRNGYNGVLSMEHEDGSVGREEGFEKGRAFLALYA